MSLSFSIWCHVEVYNSKTDEHEDLDPDMCEYKLLQTDSLEEVAEFIIEHQLSDESGVLLKLEDALQSQGFIQFTSEDLL